MNKNEVDSLIKILIHKKRDDLAKKLEGSIGKVEMSNQFGSRWNSVISSYIIFAPFFKYYLLKDLSGEDTKFLLESIHDMYPVADELPEITSVEFRMLLEDESGKNENNEFRDVSSEYIGRTSRVFVSYSTKDKSIAGKIKEQLEIFGLEVFLAHEDINVPLGEWEKFPRL
ncbi:MAG: hypothetical protein QMD77_04835 [Patescibacteria group bacterium]|nr:hypothetical protein [Patescibacteria group bacterium]